MNVLIVGSSGFIGSNLVSKFQKEGHFVIGTDIVEPSYCVPNKFIKHNWASHWRDNNELISLAYSLSNGLNKIEEAYCLAACMGGMGYIGDESSHGYSIGIESTSIVIHFIEFCWFGGGIDKVFYSSSACVYNQDLQNDAEVVSLKESDAIPANPDLLYGWQKLYSEKMFMASGLNVRIARFHNIFGKWGVYNNGKEKAPAALCRKVAMAKDGDSIEVWGTGEQTRSFLHIDECLDGVERLMRSDYNKPINIGSDEMISINDLAKMIIEISGKNLKIKNVPGPVGVMGRNSDNTLCEQVLNWRPSQKLRTGIEKLYSWIEKQIG